MWSWWQHSTLRLPRPRCMHDNATMRRYRRTARTHRGVTEVPGYLPGNHQSLNSTISARSLQHIQNHRERFLASLAGWHYIGHQPAFLTNAREDLTESAP